MVDAAEMKTLLHIISHVLPNQLGPQCQMQDVARYNSDVMATYEMSPCFPVPAKDPPLALS